MYVRFAAGMIVGLLGFAQVAWAEPQVEYYVGTSTARTKAGAITRLSTRLVKRTLDPEAGTIVEQSVTIDQKPTPRPAREHVVTLKVGADGRFTVSEKSRAFTGSGALLGKAWEWVAWQSTTKLPDGVMVESQDRRGADAITAQKTVSARDGRILALVEEKLSKVEAAEFDERYRMAFPARK